MLNREVNIATLDAINANLRYIMDVAQDLLVKHSMIMEGLDKEYNDKVTAYEASLSDNKDLSVDAMQVSLNEYKVKLRNELRHDKFIPVSNYLYTMLDKFNYFYRDLVNSFHAKDSGLSYVTGGVANVFSDEVTHNEFEVKHSD